MDAENKVQRTEELQLRECIREIKKLLYKQVPLLIKKLNTEDAQGSLLLVQAIIEIAQF